ncbi:MAG: hypothetical protein IJO13_09520 [Lachnospiraceae bacterium]|nr:hypothetical protein [Lachnospiraceae bacterium]
MFNKLFKKNRQQEVQIAAPIQTQNKRTWNWSENAKACAEPDARCGNVVMEVQTQDTEVWHWTKEAMAVMTFSNNPSVMSKIGFKGNPDETFYCDLHTVKRPGCDKSVLRITALDPVTNRRCVIHTSELTSVNGFEFRTANSIYCFRQLHKRYNY